jgi:hypothetical protein
LAALPLLGVELADSGRAVAEAVSAVGGRAPAAGLLRGRGTRSLVKDFDAVGR